MISKLTDIIYLACKVSYNLLEKYDKHKARSFRESVLADPSSVWVHNFGGTDLREHNNISESPTDGKLSDNKYSMDN